MDSTVLLTVDCLRRDHVGYYGYDRPTTPNIDAVAESGAAFEGYANCPGTRWAFQVLHTGVLSPRIDNLGVPDDYRPLAGHFQAEGYATGGFANNGWVSREYGYDRGFDTFYSVADTYQTESLILRLGKRVSNLVGETVTDQVLEPVYDTWLLNRGNEDGFTPAHSDVDTVDAALSWLTEQSEPYFLWVHFLDAHTPYGYWPEHLEAVCGNPDIDHTIHPGKEGLVNEGDDPAQRVIDTYDAGIRSADEQIGRILDHVEDSATVIITGDHGEEFGEYNGFHKDSLHRSMTDVPLIVKDDRIDSERGGEVAQHVDVPATLLAAAGIEVPDHWDGIPLQTASRTGGEPIYFALKDSERGVQQGSWKRIRSGEESKLFQRIDGKERERPLHEGPGKELGERLAEFPEENTVGEGSDSSDMSEATRENLEDLGYL